MHVEVIESRADLEHARASWETVYAADPEAQYFLSWSWILQLLSQRDRSWIVLVARPVERIVGTPVAFFPLVFRTRMTRNKATITSIVPAGSGMADYTGVICAPEYERDALAAFARHLQTRQWSELRLMNLDVSSKRVHLFTQHFKGDRFIIAPIDVTNPDGVDNAVCPFIRLSDSFEAYIKRLSANTRQKLRRLLRKFEADADLRITETNSETLERDLGALLKLWSQRWGHCKGDQMAVMTSKINWMVRQAHLTGSLFMPVLWCRREPVGMLACFLDPTKRRLLFYVAGRRTDWDGVEPGLILHAYSIRHAISQGYEIYDFLRGDEAYKFSLGGAGRRITNLSILTADKRNTRVAFAHANSLARAGRYSDAVSILRQLLGQDDRNVAAMMLLARAYIGLKVPSAARPLLERTLEIAPENASVWQAHGGIFELQARFDDALKAYDRAIEMDPSNLLAQFSRGRTLKALGEHNLALTAFHRVREIDPEFRGVSRAIVELEALGGDSYHSHSAK